MISPHVILEFWFGPGYLTGPVAYRDEWFRKSDAFDQAIGASFGDTVAAVLAAPDAALGEVLQAPAPAGLTPAHRRLALILVADQFTRNLFRGHPRAFAGDPLALALAREGVRHADDQTLPPMLRHFMYMPFEHSETLADQDESVRLFTALNSSGDFASPLDYAHRHREVIARFGRFPHRNEILGRASSAAELAFLQQPGSRF